MSALSTEQVARCVSRVTSTMLGRTFTPAAAPMAVEPWRVVSLSLKGAKPVTFALSSDRAGCISLASSMLSLDEDSLELAMIDDVLRELTNMSAGQFKRELSLDQALGLPKICDSDSLRASGSRWIHHVLTSANVHLIVSISPE